MADGDFSWLWRNEELSDFLLIIREALPRHPEAQEPAAADTDGQQTQRVRTRSGKRRQTPVNVEPPKRVTRSRPGSVAPGTESQQRAVAPPAATQQQVAHLEQQNARQAEQQPPQQYAVNQNQQHGHPQPANTRLTRRRQQQQQEVDAQQQQQGQNSNQPQQSQPQQLPADGQQHGLSNATAAGRRARRHSMQPHSRGLEDPGAAAADAAAAIVGGSGTPGRVTRSTRAKQRYQTAAAGEAELPSSSRSAAAPGTAQELQQQEQTAAAAAAGGSSRAASRRQQQKPPQADPLAAAVAAADAQTGMRAAAAAAGPSNPQQQQQQQAVEIRLPVHAVVLAGFSEYFKALICSWSGNLNRTLTLDVGMDEATAAEKMVEFMYTGKLPADAPPEELLKMIRLADQYQVTRFLAAASSTFESLPLSNVSLPVVLEVFSLPQLMIDAPEMAKVMTKARAKLLDLYGDLEKVWSSEALREQFIALPPPAIQCLLASESTSVAAENTALVALAGWIEEGPAGRTITVAQRRELLSLIRVPYLTSSFIGDVLHSVPWIRDSFDIRQLLNAFQFAVASESTRQRLASYEYGPSAATPHFRCPRPLSSVTRASFEWSIELSTIKRMVADAKLWGRVVELSSPLHYFSGFWWQLLFNVEKSPTPADAATQQQPDGTAAAAAATVVEFVGVRCHVNCGSQDYWPHVVRFKASIAALQTGFWDMDYAYMKAIEGPIVDGVGLGYPGFFALPGQAIESEAAWSRFVRGGRVHLRCEILDCE